MTEHLQARLLIPHHPSCTPTARHTGTCRKTHKHTLIHVPLNSSEDLLALFLSKQQMRFLAVGDSQTGRVSSGQARNLEVINRAVEVWLLSSVTQLLYSRLLEYVMIYFSCQLTKILFAYISLTKSHKDVTHVDAFPF